MDSTSFKLCWSDHESCLIDSFQSLLQNNSLVDCTLAAEGQYVKAHRMILSATSTYFQRLFEEESDKHPIVFLKDVKFQLLMAILDFIYSGKVQVSEEQLPEFILTAQSLHIKGMHSENKDDYDIRKETSDLNQLGEEDDATQSSSKTVEADVLNAFEEAYKLLPPAESTEDDNLMNTSSTNEDNLNNSSPSVLCRQDHQYCADNGDNASSAPFVLVSSVTENSEASVNDSEELNDFDSSDEKTDCQEEQPIVLPKEKTVCVKPLMKWNYANRVFLKLKEEPITKRTEVCLKKVKNGGVEKSVLRAAMATSQVNKIYQKSGTIVVTKPMEIYSAVSAQKQNVILSPEKRQAFIIGNRVLAAPEGAVQSGTKEWLQPPKPNLGEKLHFCPDCNKAFGKPSILANHRRTHTGEKPYQCQECGRMFNQSSNFRRHQRTHIEQRMRLQEIQ